MSKTFRPYAPRQAFLLPPSPLEWLPEDHLALFILDMVQQLVSVARPMGPAADVFARVMGPTESPGSWGQGRG